MPVNSLVTVTGKIVRIDDVQARTLRNQETVNVRSVIIKDSTGEVTVSLWRELTETTLEIGQSYRVTDLKLNFYHGVQLNTLTRSTVVKVETPAEEVTVMVDGFFMEKDKVILVCKMSSEDFVDYTCPITVLKAFTNNVEEPVNVMAEMIPFDAKLTLSGNDTIDSINKL